MAYVIAVCGSGGKTTLVKSLAKKYANENKKVCITTTTHMWYDEDVKASFIVGSNVAHTVRDTVGAKHCEPTHIALDEFLSKNKFECGRIYYIANINKEKELITPLNESDYKLICEKFDYVIIEADGSRSMPMKIPRMNNENVAHTAPKECSAAFHSLYSLRKHSGVRDDDVGTTHCEPAIPFNVDEIIIVVGMEAIGREIAAVCHRFKEFYGNDKYLSDNNIKSETIVTEELLDNFVKHYYYEPLKQNFEKALITIYKNDFARGSHSSPVRMDSHSSPVRMDSHSSPIRDYLHSLPTRSDLHSLSMQKCSKNLPERVAIVLCASGFSQRFGSNKLLFDVAHIVRDDDAHIVRDDDVHIVRDDDAHIVRDDDVAHIVCDDIVNKKLYQLMIDKLLSAKEILTNRFNEFYKVENKNDLQYNENTEKDNLLNKKNINVDILVVSQYDEILNDENYKNKVIMLKNDKASEGLSASIKLAVEYCRGSHSLIMKDVAHIVRDDDAHIVRDDDAHVARDDEGSQCDNQIGENAVIADMYDAIVFINADLPYLPDVEIANFVFNSILNKNGIAAMYSNDYKNPAYFEKKYFDDILKISGDKGPRELFEKYKMDVYKYYINDKYLLDIDTKKDLEIISK